MYEWLEKQLREVHTPKFHLLNVLVSDKLRTKAIDWPSPTPPSYREFIKRFGCALLYRELDYHLVRVYPRPIPKLNKQGEAFLAFGGYDSGEACFKNDLLHDGQESPVLETRDMSGLFETARSFGQWLKGRCAAARKHYSRKAWQHILKGPEPFNPEELEIIAARTRLQ